MQSLDAINDYERRQEPLFVTVGPQSVSRYPLQSIAHHPRVECKVVRTFPFFSPYPDGVCRFSLHAIEFTQISVVMKVLHLCIMYFDEPLFILINFLLLFCSLSSLYATRPVHKGLPRARVWLVLFNYVMFTCWRWVVVGPSFPASIAIGGIKCQ